jgi:hypothetical protein
MVFVFQKLLKILGAVAHIDNPNYLEDGGSRPAEANS